MGGGRGWRKEQNVRPELRVDFCPTNGNRGNSALLKEELRFSPRTSWEGISVHLMCFISTRELLVWNHFLIHFNFIIFHNSLVGKQQITFDNKPHHHTHLQIPQPALTKPDLLSYYLYIHWTQKTLRLTTPSYFIALCILKCQKYHPMHV